MSHHGDIERRLHYSPLAERIRLVVLPGAARLVIPDGVGLHGALPYAVDAIDPSAGANHAAVRELHGNRLGRVQRAGMTFAGQAERGFEIHRRALVLRTIPMFLDQEDLCGLLQLTPLGLEGMIRGRRITVAILGDEVVEYRVQFPHVLRVLGLVSLPIWSGTLFALAMASWRTSA